MSTWTNNTIDFRILLIFFNDQNLQILESPNEASIKQKFLIIKQYIGHKIDQE